MVHLAAHALQVQPRTAAPSLWTPFTCALPTVSPMQTDRTTPEPLCVLAVLHPGGRLRRLRCSIGVGLKLDALTCVGECQPSHHEALLELLVLCCLLLHNSFQ